MFVCQATIRLHMVDAAGVIFFSHLFTLMHDAYEQWLESVGIPLKTILKPDRLIIPIAHAEADYKSPLLLGDEVTIRIDAERIGATSFTLRYIVEKAPGVIAAEGRTVHVRVDARRHTSAPLTAALRKALADLRTANKG